MDYGKIETHERVRLTVEAMARQDFREVKRLLDSSPMETVEVHSLEYLNTFRMLPRVAALFELEMRGIALSIQVSDNQPPLMAQMAAAKEAWSRFCNEYDIEPEVLIATAGGHHPMVRQLLGWCCLPPDDELVNHWSGVFKMAATGEVLGERRH
ncbi:MULTISPECIES: hypothetical protein [Pseudomonas]|uniref:hypothetical protein n=1 Tax=Pseudomonas TaxID=286 RepID=UPI0005A68A59|nr:MULTISPECIES: hypothetical protein [Pseudomonas]KAB0532829.1 hypothetical protein F7R16_11345 [Pseudomonas chlororaphis subsp. aureofaciens]TSD25983.1 hypothetical protein FCE86_031445 [Pseudomonas sp. ATCC 13985]WDG57805.1 hypothetical protein PUP52_18335 [Pseudomonas chlororaphis]WDG64018.1 hypothetical protein PUP59_18340 [Pseudomonas chlororaphis]